MWHCFLYLRQGRQIFENDWFCGVRGVLKERNGVSKILSGDKFWIWNCGSPGSFSPFYKQIWIWIKILNCSNETILPKSGISMALLSLTFLSIFISHSHCGVDGAGQREESAEEPDEDDGRGDAPLRVARAQRPHDGLVPATLLLVTV